MMKLTTYLDINFNGKNVMGIFVLSPTAKYGSVTYIQHRRKKKITTFYPRLLSVFCSHGVAKRDKWH